MSVTAAKGFTAAGIAAGIKESGNPNLALVVNTGPRRWAAGVFTSNRVKAAPVLWSEQVLKSGELTAVVLNSGGANACTGPKGFQDTHATAEKAAEVLGTGAGEVAMFSTRLIGVLLPMEKLLPGVETAAGQLLRARRREGRHRHQDHRHRAQDVRRDEGRLRPSAAWPRAPACSLPASPPCSS
ncbi:Arginine biosynthesis bifunctional protein ArgJ [Streptomyces cyaneofuscatus]